jgi:hypothetical protein
MPPLLVEIPLAIELVLEAVDHARRLVPFRACDLRPIADASAVEELCAIGRPERIGRPVRRVGQLAGLPAREVEDVDLGFLVPIGEEEYKRRR